VCFSASCLYKGINVKHVSLLCQSVSYNREHLRGTITVQLTSCLTNLDKYVLPIKMKIFSCHTADSKPAKQEVNSKDHFSVPGYNNIILMNVTVLIRLCHPPDGSTSPKNKLLCFLTAIIHFTKTRTHKLLAGIHDAT
jgi:hypothetical protein